MDLVFLCVANSARSQIAEGLARSIFPQHVRVQSAGSAPTQLRPEATAVMAEIGIDISAQHAKGLDEVEFRDSCLLVTLCAEERCPVLPAPVRRLHWPIPDPASEPGDSTSLQGFRDARDQIQVLLTNLLSAPSQKP